MRQSGGFGDCLLQVLFILAILAVIGIVDWSTVGDWAIFILVLPVLGFVFVALVSLYGYWSDRN